MNERMMQNRPGVQQPRFPMPGIEERPFQEETLAELKQSKVFPNIARIDDQYIMFSQVGTTLRVSNVTRMVEAQERMVMIFIILLIIFSVWTYLISLLFVKSSLKNIHTLVDYVKDLDIHTLHKPVPLLGPVNDEIHIIWATLQKTLNTIKEQTDSLKDFVTHASHELKTPLMSLSSIIDVGEKTGEHKETYSGAKKVLHSINRLFETLLSITKREYHHIEKKNIDIVPLMQSIKDEIERNYPEKEISCSLDFPKSYIVSSNEEIFRIIFFNLLQNAFKYTTPKWKIHVRLHKDALSIDNSGPGISIEHIKHIWEKFWKNHQEHASKEGFGLGLYLVKLLVWKHWRTIDIDSKPNETTTFTLSFGT
jgi:two-component system, OmpR family, sensor kinase